MSSKATIKREIAAKVRQRKFNAWTIGLTHDVRAQRVLIGYTLKENIDHWMSWVADSLSDARFIEEYFIAKGMKRGPDVPMAAELTVHVYVF